MSGVGKSIKSALPRTPTSVLLEPLIGPQFRGIQAVASSHGARNIFQSGVRNFGESIIKPVQETARLGQHGGRQDIQNIVAGVGGAATGYLTGSPEAGIAAGGAIKGTEVSSDARQQASRDAVALQAGIKPPPPMPDEEVRREAVRRAITEMRLRSGRLSTILSQQQTLGGG